MRLSCVQYTAESSVSATEARLYPLLDQACDAGADWVLLPECALSLSASQAVARAGALQMDDPPVLRLREYARAHGVGLIAGSLVIQVGDQIFNRTVVIAPDGECLATYDKIHLFDVQLAEGEVYRESALFSAGAHPVSVDLPECSMGLSICFDLRFPKLYRHYAQSGAALVVVPAAFTRPTGAAHWHTLLRARAIENGLFIAAAAQCGRTAEGRETYGHSVVYDPWGRELGALGEAPGILTCDLDLTEVTRVRAQVPVLPKDRDF